MPTAGAWLPAQPCASLLRDSLRRHLGCVMREPGAGPATRRQRRCTTPIKPLPTAGTAALRPTTRTPGHRRLNIHASQPCKENARNAASGVEFRCVSSQGRAAGLRRPGGRYIRNESPHRSRSREDIDVEVTGVGGNRPPKRRAAAAAVGQQPLPEVGALP